MCVQDIQNPCSFYDMVIQRLKELDMPITTEPNGDVLALIQNNKVIGEIPSTAFPILLDAFNNPL